MARLDLRIMHVKPGMPTKVWDAIMVEGRRDVRVFPNGQQGDSSEFIEVIVTRNDADYPVALPSWSLREPKSQPLKISKSRRRKLARRKNGHKKENLQRRPSN